MNAKEVRALRSEQLALEVQTKRDKLFQLRQQATTEKVADVSQFKKLRRDVARLLTEHSARNPKAKKGSRRQAAK
jgi:ribosomal protein L29